MSKVINLNDLFPLAEDGTRGPLPKQALFMKAADDPLGAQFVAYFGGYGSGKSLILCIQNLIWGVKYGGEYVISRQFMPELRRTTYQIFKELLPKDLLIEERVADAQFRIKSMKGEAKFHFVGLDEPSKLDSLTLDGISIDEASQTSEEAFLKLKGRMRGKKGLRKMLLVGNPRGHDYIHKYFIKQTCFREFIDPTTKKLVTVDEQKRNHVIFIAPSTENKHLPPGYVAQMLSAYSPERIKRDIYGSFDSFQGQIYDGFDRSTHVIKPFRIPDEWTRFIGADHGFRNPAAFLWVATDYDGNLFVYREFYHSEWIIEEICKGRGSEKGIVALNGDEKLQGCWIDPSTKANRGKDSDFQTYLDHLPKDWPLLGANNEVETGIDRVKQYLKVDERTHKPRIFIFDTCENLIEQMTQYRYEELTPGLEANKNVKETPVKKDDHAVDALRYAVMSRPESPKVSDLTEKKRSEYGLSGSLQREIHRIKGGEDKGKKDPWGDVYGQDTGMKDDF